MFEPYVLVNIVNCVNHFPYAHLSKFISCLRCSCSYILFTSYIRHIRSLEKSSPWCSVHYVYFWVYVRLLWKDMMLTCTYTLLLLYY